MPEEKQKWILTHDSHELKKGEVYEGATLPAWLAGKAAPVSADAFEVATPGAADVKKLKAENTSLTKRAETAESSLAEATTKLEAETKRADEAVAALEAATKKEG
ncbi:MAG: hypothetical protein QM578_09320 [Pantoea sp.]|uniref:hypothetical protein n=1 Tax=Pantoea sp. TaxID=69393 RepID=UPI0039E6E776